MSWSLTRDRNWSDPVLECHWWPGLHAENGRTKSVMHEFKYFCTFLEFHSSALFYMFYRYTNYSREHVENAVRRVVEQNYANTLTARMTNSTLDLVANATFLRYMVMLLRMRWKDKKGYPISLRKERKKAHCGVQFFYFSTTWSSILTFREWLLGCKISNLMWSLWRPVK